MGNGVLHMARVCFLVVGGRHEEETRGTSHEIQAEVVEEQLVT